MKLAYQESKLNSAQYLLGEYFDTALNLYGMAADQAMGQLLVSEYAKLIGTGNSYIILGKTGYELFLDVMEKTNLINTAKVSESHNTNTKEFWAGWAMAYLQWATGRSFANINQFLPFQTLLNLYHPYHEMDLRSFVEDIEMKYLLKHSNLKLMRKRNKLTQLELAEKSNVSVRTIQMLEQNQNDINNVKAINLFNISRTLQCTMEELME